MITPYEHPEARPASDSTPLCDVVIDDERWEQDGLTALIEQVVSETLKVCGRGSGDNTITVALTDDAEVRRLNASFRGIDKPTNVLSFPSLLPLNEVAAVGGCHLGDVILAYETVMHEAEIEGKSIANHAAHLSVHGTLHICGYDHDTDEAAARMESVERAILGRFGIDDPFRDNELI